MAVRINPCYGCPISAGCELRDEWRHKVMGLGLRSVWFECPKLEDAIRPGRRVVIRHPVYDGDAEGGPEYVKHIEVKATITTIRTPGHSFACVLDPGQITKEDLFDNTKATAHEIRWRKTQAHRRIQKFLDEPDMPVCSNGNVTRDGVCETRDLNARCGCRDA